MAEEKDKGQLKVCCTCSYWSYRYKGFCHRLEQGVGKFWVCEDWRPAVAEPEESAPETLETQFGAGSANGLRDPRS